MFSREQYIRTKYYDSLMIIITFKVAVCSCWKQQGRENDEELLLEYKSSQRWEFCLGWFAPHEERYGIGVVKTNYTY